MGKDLYPRFKCPLCGWMAHLSMLEKAPHKIEIIGTQFGGFQEISYHRMWGGKKQYKAFLREKVKELAECLGMQIVGDEEYEEDEDELFEEVLEPEVRRKAGVAREVMEDEGDRELELNEIEATETPSVFVPTTHSSTKVGPGGSVVRELASFFLHFAPTSSNPVSHVTNTDSEFVDMPRKGRRDKNG